MGLIDKLYDWWTRTTLIEQGVTVLSFIFIVLTLIALIMILSQTYALKHAYDVGERTEQECGDEFYERERGDYKVKEAYEGGVKDTLENAFKILTGIIGFLAVGVAVVHIVFVWQVYNKNVLKSYTILPFIKNPDSIREITGWVNLRNYVPHILSLILTLYIASIWLANTFAKSSQFSTKGIAISPLNVTIDQSGIANMYAAQVGYIATLLIITGLVIYLPLQKDYNSKLFENLKIKSSLETLLIVVLAVLFVAIVMIPVVSSIILKIRQPISEYISNYTAITVNKQDKEQESTLIRNIYRSDPTKAFPDLSNYTDDDLKSYVTHNINYSDLQAIPVPDDLRPFIHQSSLRGEAFLNFKKDLVAFYNDRNNGSYIIPETGAPLAHANPNIIDNKDEALIILFKHFTKDARDMLLLTTNLTPTQIENKRNLLDILNTQVINNSAYNYANPFSSATLTKLREMRENKSIRDTVNSMHSISTGIIFMIFAIALYFLIHYFYLRNPRNALIVIASLVAVLLIIGVGFVGFVTKDTWL